MNGEQLKKRVRATGKSQKQVAEAMNVTPQTVAAMFTAQDVRSSTLERLCDVLGVKMNYFYDGTDYAVDEYQNGSGLAEEIDKDKMIMLLKGQIMAYEKALGAIGKNSTSDTLKKNVG